MAQAHKYLHEMLSGSTSTVGLHWPHVLGMLVQICRARSPESEAVLREAAEFEGTLALDPERGLPHSMSPEDFLRSIAVQTLGKWDKTLHQDAIIRAVALADHERVVTNARPYLL